MQIAANRSTSRTTTQYVLPSGERIVNWEGDAVALPHTIAEAEALAAAHALRPYEAGPMFVVVLDHTRVVEHGRFIVTPALYARCVTPNGQGAKQIRHERECGGPRTGGSWFEAETSRHCRAYVPVARASDHELASAMAGAYGQSPEDAREAAKEWLRRYPDGAASRCGSKAWAVDADDTARKTVAA